MNKNIKNVIVSIVFSLFTILSFSGVASASSTISFDSTGITTKLNQDFKVNVYVDAQDGVASYTAKTAIRFSGEQLSLTSFEFAPEWIAINVDSYDLVDNTNGLLIKTAGYPGGFSGKKLMGTITFTSKSSSISKISISNKSFVLDGNSDNVYTGESEIKTTVLNTNGTIPSKEFILPLESSSNSSILE